MAILEVNGVTKVYKGKHGEITAVNDATFTVDAGEVVGFVGPNGAGKSTLIKMITGLSAPTSGTISICGYDNFKHRKEAIVNVGAVVENPDMYLDWSAEQNLKYLMSLTSKDSNVKEYSEARVSELLQLMGIYDRARDKVRKFSLGMKQRLGIAQALLSNPKLLILDEPANGLDPSGIREIREILIKLATEYNMAVFISSHQLSELQMTCDRFLIINKGKIVAMPTKAELVMSGGKIVINVDDVIRARDILKSNLGVECAIVGNGKLEATTEIQAGEISKELIMNGVLVSGIYKKETTLEEFYTSMTSKKKEAEQSVAPQTEETDGEDK